MKKKNQLDEQQEQKLLRIEHNGCWLAFWGLLAALAVQMIFFDLSFARIAGEWIVFMVLALYMVLACIRAGIWDRRLKMNLGTNVMVSLVGALAAGLLNFLSIRHRFPDSPGGAASAGAITAVVTFVLCFVALTLASKVTARRQARINAEPEEEEKDFHAK